jgi:hypothetical protein
MRARRRDYTSRGKFKGFYNRVLQKVIQGTGQRENVISDIPSLYLEENNILIADFTEEEVFEAIYIQNEHNKAP